jgi:hypothetical protein
MTCNDSMADHLTAQGVPGDRSILWGAILVGG